MRRTLSLLSACLFLIVHLMAQNVGIGTTTPVNLLSVNGSADFADNVGIGIVSPVKKLHVQGAALINSLSIGTGNGNQPFSTGLGIHALLNNTSGFQNTAVGYLSLTANTEGSDNVGAGAYALNYNSTGSSNTAVGLAALQYNTNGSSNTAMGVLADVPEASNLTNATAIGANALVTASNSLILGNNANVGIGTSAPTSKLEVVGNTKTTNLRMTNGATNGFILKSDASGNANWANFNTLETDPQVGTFTLNKSAKWNGSALVEGVLYDNGTQVGINTTTPGAMLDVKGTVAGIRLLSGGTGSGNHTSIQIGRIAADGSLGVAAVNGNYAVGALPGDIILRTETSAQKLILNSGSGNATLVVDNGLTGIGVINPLNTLDVASGLSIGASYTGNVAPTNGLIIQGTTGIGTSSPTGQFHVVTPFPKTEAIEHIVSHVTTNEAIANHPFGLRVSLHGGNTIESRSSIIQTTEIGADGGNLVFQRDGGYVGIGTMTPQTHLDVDGGIRTKYCGGVVIEINPNPIPGLSFSYDLDISPPLPAGWDHTNTAFFVMPVDGMHGLITQAELEDSDTISIAYEYVFLGPPVPTRFHWIAFPL